MQKNCKNWPTTRTEYGDHIKWFGSAIKISKIKIFKLLHQPISTAHSIVARLLHDY